MVRHEQQVLCTFANTERAHRSRWHKDPFGEFRATGHPAPYMRKKSENPTIWSNYYSAIEITDHYSNIPTWSSKRTRDVMVEGGTVM